MSRPPKEGLAWGLAGLLTLPAVLFPVYNPDLFWHLSAGRWIFEHHALPRADFLSSTLAGRPWLDFEWLSQLAYYGAYAAAGLWGVWLLKVALLSAAIWSFALLLRALEAPRAARPASVALFSAVQISYADARPDLFSLILLAWLLRRLELGTLGPIFTLSLFAVWSSLHAGFALGLIALALYAAAAWFSDDLALARRRGACLAAAAAGACLNPYGLGAYSVVWSHWREQGDLARAIKEWGPLGFDNPMYWPAWALLLLLAAACVYRLWKRPEREPSWPLLGLAAYLAVASLQHERAVVFFALAGAAALALLAPASGKAHGLVLAALVVFFCWLAPAVRWRPPLNTKFVPSGTAAFASSQREVLEPLKIFNDWGWGGYLGFALSPWYRVSSDGRYLFHAQHVEEARAWQTAESWDAYSRAQGYEGAIVPNYTRFFAASRRYPDGSFRAFRRPWYLTYFQRERWALVYWDWQGLLFVERDKVSEDWLAAHEYRWLRPNDAEAFADAAKRGEVPLEAAADEKTRHTRELSGRP